MLCRALAHRPLPRGSDRGAVSENLQARIPGRCVEDRGDGDDGRECVNH
jgi:hypothetical protein